MSQINIRNLSNENDDGSPEIVGVSTFSATSFFVPPKGSTAERPSDCEPGSIRFNTDTANLEYFRGKTIGWSQFELVTPNLGGGTGSNTGLGARGLFMGGYSPSGVYDIEFITISTLGDSQDFGDLANTHAGGSTTNDRTRGWYSGGSIPSAQDHMTFVTIASLGNATDAGSLTAATQGLLQGLSSSTRGLQVGGRNSSGDEINLIQYHTIQSLGNAVDFGDLTAPTGYNCNGIMSSTRGITSGGYSPDAPTIVDKMEFVTMATLGNATDFGNLSRATQSASGASNSTRGLICGGRNPSIENNIEFITIATTGNTTDFGDLAQTGLGGDVNALSSPTRCVISGGGAPSGGKIGFVEISTLGNSTFFGDLTLAGTSLQSAGTVSNGHGGL